MDAMSDAGACRDWTDRLGPYLLGQLDANERLAVEDHLAECHSCAVEIAELRPVIDLLPRLDPAHLAGQREVPSPLLAARIVREVARRRRRGLVRLALGAAACAALVVALVLGGGALDRQGDDVTRRPLVAVGAAATSGEAGLVERSWGTHVTLELEGLTPGTDYGAWLERADGSRVLAGTFRADGTSIRLTLGAALPLDEGRAVGVSTLDGQDVLRAELT
jgi:hypothetical protein